MDLPCVFFPFKISYRLDTRFVLYLNAIWLLVLASHYNGYYDNERKERQLLRYRPPHLEYFQDFQNFRDFKDQYSQDIQNDPDNATKHSIHWLIPTMLTTVYALTYIIIRFMRLKYPSIEARLGFFPTPSDPNSCDSWYNPRRATYCAWVFALDFVFLVAYLYNHTERATFWGNRGMSVFLASFFNLAVMFLAIAIWRLLMWVPYLEWVHQNERMRSRARAAEKGEMVSVDVNSICQCQSRNVPVKDTFARFFWVWEL